MIRKPFSIILTCALLPGLILAGCGGSSPTAVSQATEPQALGTMPVEHTSIPTPELTLTMTAPQAEPVSLVNPGFEDQQLGETPAGWTHAGAVEAVRLDENGHSGN